MVAHKTLPVGMWILTYQPKSKNALCYYGILISFSLHWLQEALTDTGKLIL